MKLYKYEEDFGRMGSLECLFFSTPEEISSYRKIDLWWDELLGKHSEGSFDLSDENLRIIELPEGTEEILYKEFGKVVSGVFDFDFFEELLQEQDQDE